MVPNTLKALGDLARQVRLSSTAHVLAVTGSVGKTTVKEMAALVLGAKYSTLKSEANENNEVGLPATLLRLEPMHRAAVVEMGMRGPGEIRYLAGVARPDAVLITMIGVSHIGRLGSRDAIARAKAEAFDGLQPGGFALLNRDNDCFDYLAGLAPRTVSFGLHPAADVQGRDVVDRGLQGMEFTCCAGEAQARVRLSAGGKHLVIDGLAALAAGVSLGVPLEDGALALAEFSAVGGRGRMLSGLGGTTIVDDTYNASPDSVIAALDALAQTPECGRRMAVLGDMLEMGEHSEEGHRKVGRAAACAGLELLVCVGIESRAMADEAIHAGLAPASVQWHLRSQDAAANAQQWSRDMDLILVKGSNSMGMLVIVQALTGEASEPGH
jgi:UDP-N-acetylmuramoyl-tripeptide--D-alanyl-D-alanine ligase